MTTLAMHAQPRHDARTRLVPWRRMGWATWRQHRSTLAGVVAVLGVASVYLYFTGEQIRHQGFVSYGAGPGLTLIADLFQVIPPLIGAFVGAPVLAKELETGTFRFTWTQGFGRARWTAATLAPLALAVALVAGAFGFLFSWCYGSQIDGKYFLSPLAGTTFDLRGVTLAAWALVAFAIGVLAGNLIRRVVPAMFATLVTWSGLAAVTAAFLRPHYESSLVTSNPNLPRGAWAMSQSWARGGKPVSTSTINQILQKVGLLHAGTNQAAVAIGSPVPVTNSTSPTQYLLHDGFTLLTNYQPASRFWPFQWIEGGWLIALSLLLMGTAVWLVQRRAT